MLDNKEHVRLKKTGFNNRDITTVGFNVSSRYDVCEWSLLPQTYHPYVE